MFTNFEPQAYLVCDVEELEKYINKTIAYYISTWKWNFSFSSEETSQNPCTVLEYLVEKKRLEDYDLRELDNYYQDSTYGVYVDHLLQDLCYSGYLMPGKYLIRMA